MVLIIQWLLVITILNLYACSGKTECVNISKLAVIANLKSKKCISNINNQFYSQDVDDDLFQKYNFDYEDWRVEIIFLDSCGSNVETLKAIFKTIIWADIDCLKPPHFLGFIGPEQMDNLNVSQKITSALEIPHIVSVNSKSINTHQILQQSNMLIVTAIFKIIEIFGWKSFFFWSNSENEVIKRIVHQFTLEASARKYCFMTSRDAAKNFIILGKPDQNLIYQLSNSSIIIVNDKKLEIFESDYNSTNTYLILDNLTTISSDGYIRNNELLLRKNMPILNERNELLLVPDAIKIYMSALDSLCTSKSCNVMADLKFWNQIIMNTIITYNKEKNKEKHNLIFKVKAKFGKIESMGKITYYEKDMQLYWNNKLLDATNQIAELNNFKNFFATPVLKTSCHQNINNIIKMKNEIIDDVKTDAPMIFALNESDWWSMVATVTAVGITMFSVGFFAVYIVYTNIRVPRTIKLSGAVSLDRDSSLKRIGSDRNISANIGRSSRVISGLQRRDSRNSITSNISEKSV